MAILAISLVAVFQSQSQSISMAGDSRFLTTASLLAQSKMTEIEAVGMTDVKTEKGDFGAEFPDYIWRVEVKDTELENVKKIEMTVTHNRMTRNNNYLLELYRFVSK